MRKGSITVFLSLILSLLFSFLLTTLEAARIRGATAYVSMVTELAGESMLATYYYPLFQNYRLFGIHAGDEEGFFAEQLLKEDLEKDVVYGMEEQEGGLLRFQNTEAAIPEYETMLSEGEKEFLSQIRQQTVLDGLSLVLDELFTEGMFTEAGVVGEIHREQEAALEATATVTKEVIKLMENVDGIRMKANGIDFDRHGKLQANGSFVKQIAPLEQGEIQASYDNSEVFHAVSDQFYRIDRAAGRVLDYLEQIAELDKKIKESKERISGYQRSLVALGEQLSAEWVRISQEKNPDMSNFWTLQNAMESVQALLEQDQMLLKEYEDKRKTLLKQAEGEYNTLRSVVVSVRARLGDSLNVATRLEKKQQTAKVVVGAYELFLEGKESKLSGEVYQVFCKELEKMKLYAGLEENGFSVVAIQQSLSGNYSILASFLLEGFSEDRLGEVAKEMSDVIEGMGGYTIAGLSFPYGEIVVAEETWENVIGALGSLLTTGILSLVGVSKEEQSDCKLTGVDLPSDGLEKDTLLEELMGCIDEVIGLFQEGGMGEVLKAAGNALLDETALELYNMKYFHCFGAESDDTKLKYEREYLIFGGEKDKSNLLAMVLHLVAIRTLFCMVMIMKQPDRMSQLDLLSAGVVGFTGIPALAAVLKYVVLLLWAVDEALVEVAALLEGKRVPVIGTGEIALSELFRMNKTVIWQKAQAMPEGIGAAYSDYLALLSLTKRTRTKAYRAMDLIQENLRYRYNDAFRIRNVVTQFSFSVTTELKPLFDTGLFPEGVYEMECRKERAY